MTTYTATIGLEIHAELKTRSKMFCGCPNDPHGSEPNTNICPVCLAHPGTLPTVNKEAVKALVRIGDAVDGEIAAFTEFDRKNYFYPDIPKAYQISQYEFPFVKGGELAGVTLTRIHLEEDTARSSHQDDRSFVDFNRAGVPLMELVTEPVIRDAATASRFARELQLLLRTLGISDANMEKGEMRVEANISVSNTEPTTSPDGHINVSSLGTKVEVKNLNSFRSMEAAIEYEISRQSEILAQNKDISSETRGWDENKNVTFSQRTKETADDYRYFPDPDIPKFDLSKIEEFARSEIRKNRPMLPAETRVFLEKMAVPEDRIDLLLSDSRLLGYFKSSIDVLGSEAKGKSLQIVVNYLTSDIAGLLQKRPNVEIPDAHSDKFVALVRMVVANQITSRVAKDLLQQVVFDGIDPEKTAEERGLLQQNDEESLRPIVDRIIQEHAGVAAEYKAGKEASLQFLVGQGMKATKGSANPQMLADMLKKCINE